MRARGGGGARELILEARYVAAIRIRSVKDEPSHSSRAAAHGRLQPQRRRRLLVVGLGHARPRELIREPAAPGVRPHLAAGRAGKPAMNHPAGRSILYEY